LPSWATLRTTVQGPETGSNAARGRIALELDHAGRDVVHQVVPGAPSRDEAPAIEDRQLVAALRLIHEMGRDEHGGAVALQLEQQVPEVAPALRIDRAGRLVQDQQARLCAA
jgi:hypothetical protein